MPSSKTSIHDPRGAGDSAPAAVPAVLRTPDARFDAVADFPYPPRYRDFQGLRLAHIDEGEGLPVVFLHGSPAWSYLWRKVIPPVRDAGFRCIAPDQIGYGRSDKPTDLGWYNYDRYVEAGAHLLAHLDLTDVTLVLHDWGVPVGLRLAAEQPDRVRRLVVMNGALPLGLAPSDGWRALRRYIEETPDLPVGALIRAGCAGPPPEAVVSAYEAPFPEAAFKAGPRAGPLLRPTSPDHPDAARGRAVRDVLRGDGRPKLLIWGAADPIMPLAVGEALATDLGCEPPIRIDGASHFLQEDRGEEVAALICGWLASRSA
jgi:haloalkane dehalogenase